jgi:hypothetical protein
MIGIPYPANADVMTVKNPLTILIPVLVFLMVANPLLLDEASGQSGISD